MVRGGDFLGQRLHLNSRPFHLALAVSLCFISCCGSSPEEQRKEANQRQLEALLEIQAKKDQITRKILTYDFVRTARVFFSGQGVIAEITIKSSDELGREKFDGIDSALRTMGEEVNAFITGITGYTKDNISLRVSPSG